MNLTVKMIEKDIEYPASDIKSLWSEAFGDDEGFIEGVITSPDYRGAVCAFLDGELIGAAHLLAFAGRDDALYCYAVATSERSRGLGICSEILSLLRRYSDENNVAILLHPASRSLSGFYEARGFKPLAYTHSYRCTGDGGSYNAVSVSEYAHIRDFAYGGRGYFGWSEDVLSLTGLSFIGFDVDGEYCAAAVYGDKIYEVCASPLSYGKAVRRAASFAGEATVLEQTDVPLGAVCSVMGYNVNDYTYFGLFIE